MKSVHPKTEHFKNKSYVFTGSTLCRSNLKTVFCVVSFVAAFRLVTQRSSPQFCVPQKQIKCFVSTLRQSNKKRQQSHRPYCGLGFVKDWLRFPNLFRSTSNHTWNLQYEERFEKFCFCDQLLWTKGQTVKAKAAFSIPQSGLVKTTDLKVTLLLLNARTLFQDYRWTPV